jgi:hypothetical protein
VQDQNQWPGGPGAENHFLENKAKTIWGLGKPKNSDIDGTGVKMVPFSSTQQKRFFLSL